MINPARAAFRSEPVEIQAESLEAVGLVPVKGRNFFKRRGYLAGTDEERAADLLRATGRAEAAADLEARALAVGTE